MSNWRDRFNKIGGRSRFVVCRVMLHLSGSNIAPLLGTLNRVGREAIDSDGDLDIVGEGLVEVCQSLLEYEPNWRSAANEGDVFTKEEEAGDYITELFTDSAQRYLSRGDFEEDSDIDEPLSLSPTENIIVMITIACEGEVPSLETNLAELEAMEDGLKTLIDLHHGEKLRAIQIHFSPAQLGDELTQEQILMNYSELIPL
ncbi:DUF1517 domain-containing protein [Oscillatoriales cyanobacterium LEGE 11467]|uniref:DUF1517 domain-containing protein n=1 Tax=Zarconia navalis LEGE 11467 TaxID=1828826 RepID=A0A928W1R7_9CYAN|nr:DUF1517 domain-containing protein [Zarconia navalis]MBE9041655.1 DUF1517 domain-containing protein [Zarconia navalis LEGE 11467]